MTTFILKVKALTASNDDEKAPENWAANIELGVLVDVRLDDPGESFDGNYPGGAATPRTTQLREVDLIIQSVNSGADVPWTTVAAHLETAQATPTRLTAAERLDAHEFTLPHLEQRTESEQGFVRDKPT